MPITVPRNGDVKQTVAAATLILIEPSDLVKIVWIRCSAAFEVVVDPSLSDGDALPANRGWPVAAGEAWPQAVVPGFKILVSVPTGAGTLSCIGEQ
ncbi:MAG: hypothetical protein HOP09_14720 [Hyphomicrobium sp.]|nr:hypothetical protein [Hyphomicrobium sp.]